MLGAEFSGVPEVTGTKGELTSLRAGVPGVGEVAVSRQGGGGVWASLLVNESPPLASGLGASRRSRSVCVDKEASSTVKVFFLERPEVLVPASARVTVSLLPAVSSSVEVQASLVEVLRVTVAERGGTASVCVESGRCAAAVR